MTRSEREKELEATQKIIKKKDQEGEEKLDEIILFLDDRKGDSVVDDIDRMLREEREQILSSVMAEVEVNLTPEETRERLKR